MAPASANEDGKSNARPANDKEAARPAPPPPAPVPSTTAPDGAPAAQAWSQAEIIEALQSCLKALGPVVAEIEAQAPLRAGDCGVAAPVALAAVGAHPRVEMRPPPMLNCAVAGRLSRWMEDVVQPAARELFGAPVVKMLNVSGYQCRNRNGASGPAGKTSEHAFANAIDVGAFELANGRRVDVGTDWGPTERDLLEARASEVRGRGHATGHGAATPARGRSYGGAASAAAARQKGRGCEDGARGPRRRCRPLGLRRDRLGRWRACGHADHHRPPRADAGGAVPAPIARGRVRAVRHGARA